MAPPKLLRTFILLLIATLAIFGGLVATLTLELRGKLREEVLQREAEAIHAVGLLEIGSMRERAAQLRREIDVEDVFTAILESSKLRGVFAVQLFDANDVERAALPPMSDSAVARARWPRPLATPFARFIPRSSLEELFGRASEAGQGATIVPLLDVVIPWQLHANDPAVHGVARYWIDGRGVAAEFERMDVALWSQAGLAFASAALLVSLVLAWAFLRLRAAHRHLLEQSADLRRANQELDFAAKTGALGAITAHLIHGLKNPLAGLEGFVAEGAAQGSGAMQGEAWQSAVETTRRLRLLVGEVATALRDEADEAADIRVSAADVLAAARARAEPAARAARVEIVIPASAGAVDARTASLAGLILANLLANAIAVSVRGQRVILEARDNDGRIEFLVTDQGPGLPGNVQAALFRPVPSSKPGGSGLGLAISHRLARHAGGDLKLVDTNAQGTVFCLTVPAHRAKSP